jgi:integrase
VPGSFATASRSVRWPPLRFHDLRHTFASHLIIDLGLDIAQVSHHPRPRERHDHA